MKRCVIFAAADIDNYNAVKKRINPDDFIICADGGVRHALVLGIEPNSIIGDFDSFDIEKYNFNCKVIRLNTVKDDTDSMSAVREGIKNGCREFLFFGILGGRIDHTLANLHLLEYLDKNCCKGTMLYDKSEIIFLKNNKIILKKDKYENFSLIILSETANNVTIKGAKYNLENAVITRLYQYGISNVFESDTVKISIGDGSKLIFSVKRAKSAGAKLGVHLSLISLYR